MRPLKDQSLNVSKNPHPQFRIQNLQLRSYLRKNPAIEKIAGFSAIAAGCLLPEKPDDAGALLRIQPQQIKALLQLSHRNDQFPFAGHPVEVLQLQFTHSVHHGRTAYLAGREGKPDGELILHRVGVEPQRSVTGAGLLWATCRAGTGTTSSCHC